MAERTVRKDLIPRWIRENGPYGILRLSEKSRVSHHTISKIQAGYIPKKEITRECLAAALGVTADELFPLVTYKGKGPKAS
jgi:transcriptional regulator with XRE-family HTH domain